MQYIFPIMFVGILACVIYVFAKSIAGWMRNSLAPVERVQAAVIGMEKKDDTSMVPVGTDGAMMPISGTAHHVRFQTVSGNVQDFIVPGEVYESLTVGTEGILESKGTRFLNFEIA